ncbi:MAG: prepilin peptidase, partial [Candidatus Gastranaerophilales bacterium]|nr:prepilin peptidase [Candidatus Gastranaerophilales bacterium]
SIVITITDIKKNEIYDVHNWSLIIMSIVAGLYFKGINNYYDVAIGLITGVFVMEAVARLSYYLIKKKNSAEQKDLSSTEAEQTALFEEKAEEKESQTSDNDNIEKKELDIDINEYMTKNKRAFGEGDTYIAAASGALLGWKYLLISIGLAIILQAICILPMFIITLSKQKKYKLLISLSAFVVLSLLYWILSNLFTLNLYIVMGYSIVLLYLAIDIIIELKKTTNKEGYKAIPFGPALLFSTFLIFFFGTYIIGFLKHYIFMI